jgi:hypothetical protein
MDDADLKRVAEAATPGPWVAQGRYLGTPNHMSFVAECRDQNGNWTTDRMSKANATFIATFDPPTVLSLLSRLSAAEARVGVLEGALRLARDRIAAWEGLDFEGDSDPLRDVIDQALTHEPTP